VKPVLLDVGDERVELGALHQRKQVGERMEWERGGRHDVASVDFASYGRYMTATCWS
jgi:hypothetical protein